MCLRMSWSTLELTLNLNLTGLSQVCWNAFLLVLRLFLLQEPTENPMKMGPFAQKATQLSPF